MHLLGINCLGPNTSACLIEDGRLVAMAEEERFSRIKVAANAMPVGAIGFCLKQAGIRLSDVAGIALGWDLSLFPDGYRREVRELYPPMLARDELVTDQVALLYSPQRVRDELRFALRAAGVGDAVPPVIEVPHHLAHAASTFFTSGFDESLILTIDGSGELLTTALWHGKGPEIKPLREWKVPQSLGWFYAAITEFLGFRAYTGEGKVMGLAPYGSPNPAIREKLSRFVRVTPDGFEIDPTYIYFGAHAHRARFTDKLVELLGEPHLPGRGDFEPRHLDVAFEAQRLLEEAAASLVRLGFSLVPTRNLCLSGGVGMNCKMNGFLAELPEVEAFYVFPGANDGGTALGAALWSLLRDFGGDPRRCSFQNAYLGPEYSNAEIEAVLKRLKLDYDCPADMERTVAEELRQGRFVGWFQGRMEYGSRALGNRSILADPSRPEVKDRINAQVKHREGFRPFAPSVLAGLAERCVQRPTPAPYMMLAFQATEELARQAPAVVHKDNTVRPQFVTAESNPRYHRLIEGFHALSGLPCVLNTSFNIRGEPIVCTPVDAIKCFYGTGLDTLVLGDFVLRKKVMRARRDA